MGEKLPGGELVRVNYAVGKFARIPIGNYFYISCFLFSVSILRVKFFRVIVRGKFSLKMDSLVYIFVGRGFLHGGGATFPGIILKTIRS